MESNLSQYRIFYEAAKCRSISGAAKNLYISQPAVSKTISNLENSLNVKLFFRNPRGVTLTEEGKILFRYIDSAFNIINEGEEQLIKSLELGIGHLKIGVSTTLCKYVLLPYLKAFINDNPHIRISIQNQSSSHTIELVEQRQIDIGLVAEPLNKSGFVFIPVKQIEDCFAVSGAYIDNLKLRNENISDSQSIFSNATVMMLDKNNVTRSHLDTYMQNSGIYPGHILEVSTMGLIIDFAKIGLGIGCVIKDFIKDELQDGSLKEICFPEPVPARTIGFIYKDDSEVSRSIKKFLDFISEYNNIL